MPNIDILIFIFSEEVEKEELLDGAESQNYGYGYGTKVTANMIQ